jgi:hypothetical protein
VTAEVVRYLRGLTAAGARLHGAADPTFTTVRVLVADERGGRAAERTERPAASATTTA